MEEIDLSRPGVELFPQEIKQEYNSYLDVNTDQVVGDPLGVQEDVASPEKPSDKEMNFRALREEASKFKEEREYWKGQAEAYSRAARPDPVQQEQQDAYTALDWDDGRDVRKAFETLKQQNDSLRTELKDAVTAIRTQVTHKDWDNMVTQNVPQLTQKNPIFAEMIHRASNPYEAAYLLAELNAKASQQAQQAQRPDYGQRAITNSQKPQTLNSVGGNGQLSSADYYASMSDADFIKIASRNLANI